jgi:pimeloyl-ACP methyl ester carboxylesterase
LSTQPGETEEAGVADSQASKRPIVYVRGYAGTTSGIDQQVDDPFYGFNLGSTHVRVGRAGDPIFYQFESPLLRLMMDEGYELHVKGNQAEYLDLREDGSVPPATIWIHRFYDVSASTWGERPEEFRLERAARDLLKLIETLQRKTGAATVDLIAHSMGGLICRSLIQKIIPDEYGTDKRATDFVGRLFTYGTPHGGIEFAVGGGMIERLRDAFGVAGADVFGPGRMYEYLTPKASQADGPPEGWKPQDMPDDDNFPLGDMLCLIGTDPEDYLAAHGLSAKAVGAKSDGLVQIENAYVPGANHAFVHRSHSGRYGLVNSEEGYQNLWRFLFGDVKVTADLVRLRIPQGEEVLWQAEVRLSVRGLPILMHEQTAAHYCPIQLVTPSEDDADRPVPLITTFLSTKGSRPENADSMRYSLHVRVFSLRQEGGVFRFFDHLEQSADFDDVLVVDVKPRAEGPPTAWAAWNSEIPGAIRDYKPQGDPLGDENPDAGVWEAHVPLPEAARSFLGAEAAVFLAVAAR